MSFFFPPFILVRNFFRVKNENLCELKKTFQHCLQCVSFVAFSFVFLFVYKPSKVFFPIKPNMYRNLSSCFRCVFIIFIVSFLLFFALAADSQLDTPSSSLYLQNSNETTTLPTTTSEIVSSTTVPPNNDNNDDDNKNSSAKDYEIVGAAGAGSIILILLLLTCYAYKRRAWCFNQADKNNSGKYSKNNSTKSKKSNGRDDLYNSNSAPLRDSQILSSEFGDEEHDYQDPHNRNMVSTKQKQYHREKAYENAHVHEKPLLHGKNSNNNNNKLQQDDDDDDDEDAVPVMGNNSKSNLLRDKNNNGRGRSDTMMSTNSRNSGNSTARDSVATDEGYFNMYSPNSARPGNQSARGESRYVVDEYEKDGGDAGHDVNIMNSSVENNNQQQQARKNTQFHSRPVTARREKE